MAITTWAMESESDVSDAGSEVDLEREDEAFAIEEERNVNLQSVFLKDMLSEQALVPEAVDGQEELPESFTKAILKTIWLAGSVTNILFIYSIKKNLLITL